ncbi:MAG: hypothetical protein RR107_04765 [Clostridia bacterium]
MVGLLVCAILASVVTGTLAVYQASIDEMTGDVVAKQFVIDANKTADYKTGLQIAPGEKLQFSMNVMNFKGGVTTETAMEIAATFDFAATANKKNLAPLKVTIVKTGDNGIVRQEKTARAGEKITFSDNVKQSVATTINYAVTIEWVTVDNATDTSFQGAAFGNDMNFTATGTQIANIA